MTSDPPAFDICGELSTGTTVLEASAGTGKTYTIAALTARIIAEGATELNQLLLVTFGVGLLLVATVRVLRSGPDRSEPTRAP